MRSNTIKSRLIRSGLAASILLLCSGAALAQSVSLTAAATTATLPDGQVVPMWGYTCSATTAAVGSTCANLNPAAPAATATAPAGWSPVIITVPAGTPAFTVTLTNSLPAPVPTSLVIVGQIGGGLGLSPTRVPSPTHAPQGATWPIAGPPDTGTADTSGNATFTPPAQVDRVQSFATEVANGATTVLTWNNLKVGTYLIESGTHPSIQGPMGLYGVLVVTTAPNAAAATGGTAYGTVGTASAVSYNAEVPLLLSEIDAVQNTAVATAVITPGFNETTVWSGQPGQCGNAFNANGTPNTTTYHTCYPPAVNYDPRYYLVNGVSFDRTMIARSIFTATPAPATGAILVRFVNAGLRMHVPSIVGAQTGASGAAGFAIIAEDGNVLPGNPKIQNEVFMAAGKTNDVLINAPVAAAGAAAPAVLAVFDRQLSLSTNNQRDGGMQAYLSANAASTGPIPAVAVAATSETYYCVSGAPLVVSDLSRGVLANDVGANGASIGTVSLQGGITALAFRSDGTFTYTPPASPAACGGTFTYLVNGLASATGTATITQCDASTSGCAALGAAPTANADSYTSNIATFLQVGAPGVLANDRDPSGHPLSVNALGAHAGLNVTLNPDGSFTAAPSGAGGACPAGSPAGAACYSFQYTAKNSQNRPSNSATATLIFGRASGLVVTVKDAPKGTAISDYRWIIEEDRTFNINPACTTTLATGAVPPAGCPSKVQNLGTNFHTSYMPVVAAGCVGSAACESGQMIVDPAGTGAHVPTVCDVGNGACRTTAAQQTAVNPSQVALDPTKRYYISVLPGDAGNSFTAGAGAPVNGRVFDLARDCPNAASYAPGTGTCGHTMGGAPIPAVVAPATTFAPVTVLLQPTPLPTAKVVVFAFEDDSPVNGEHDSHGGNDLTGLNNKEPGLGGFEITLFDDAGGTGDATGQMTYDMFNMPLSNSLAGTIDQNTGFDACPISTPNTASHPAPDHLLGMIVTCPDLESDGVSASPLAGQAVISNLMPGRYGVVATPGADRIARGEEWLQTNTLDGQKAHDAFIRVGGPAYFQEFGPAGYHVAVGFANGDVINNRRTNSARTGMCDPVKLVNGVNTGGGGLSCNNSVTGTVTNMRISRSPDQRVYSSGSAAANAFTNCYVSLGDPDDDDFAFTKCNADGTFTLSGLPAGNWRITTFDQWNDLIVDGLSTPVALGGTALCPGTGSTATRCNMGDLSKQQWHTNLYTRTFFDLNGNGVSDNDASGNLEPGLTLVPTNVRFRDGSYSNFNNTDLNGFAGFNEIFPLFNWYVLEADTNRYKQTGVHVVYDAGGPADGNGGGNSSIGSELVNTIETVHLPTNLRFPGSVYCANADCTGASIRSLGSSSANPSTGRIDPPWVTSEGVQGFIGGSGIVEFGKAPYAPAVAASGGAAARPAENGGIKGEVIYASTRPFDDPTLLIHTSWTPDVPGVTINLYREGVAADGTLSRTLVDTTKTSSWDDWAQGFRVAGSATTPGTPNMNCPGQLPGPTATAAGDLFFFTLAGSTQWLNPATALPNNSQFKCYDGMHAFNQVQPAPYDGMYQFPSIVGRNPTTGVPTGTGTAINAGGGSRPGSNCTICIANPVDGTPMLPSGKYTVEMIVPPGYELVKEEDKNILIGDNYIAPVTQQFGGLGSIFILPDQAEVAGQYNANNAQNPTMNLNSQPRHEGDTGSIETFWPCVGQLRTVPDYISLFPYSQEVAPFAGAARHLCDRKQVTLEDQTQALAKFWVFSSTHVAAHYTGFMLDDFSSEFDPFSPQFGEKFAVPNLPVSIKDFDGNEIERVYADQWGQYNGLNYSTWQVNPPNPTGYAPTMMVACMNDPGTGATPDPLYNPAYSQFCYEIPYMPGQTQYMDTPVVPTAAFAEGYNPADCAYPDATPAIASVLGDSSGGGAGPWVSAAGHSLTINALGFTGTTDVGVQVPNNAYSGPAATVAPYNQKFITRHYGFGASRGSGSVTIGGATAAVSAWANDHITVSVPNLSAAQSSCTMQQSGVTAATRCGELVITAGNGRQSIDTVTVTIGGKAPGYVNGENAANNAIQTALDNATPGDLIIVGPGYYNEMLVMWKPVRLQGVGSGAVKVNANTHPSGKMDAWRRQVACLFGLSLNGGFIGSGHPFDPNGNFTCPTAMQGQVDPIPLEPLVGWDPTLNGNLAELLMEPTLMGAYEGAGITVVGKGLRNNNTPGVCDAIDANGCIPLTANAQDCAWKSNFRCNPSRIDGMSFLDSSQGGGGIFLHGWNHYTEVSNNRAYANAGTLSGGITIGQPETPDPTVVGTDAQPLHLNDNVQVHHNSVTQNAAYGDELNSTTPSAAGGVTFCTGADNYKFNHNWVCGNLSTGDGGGFAHLGFSANGNISNNQFLFNQSSNPTIPTHGGGVTIIGDLPDGPVCEALTPDTDCPPDLTNGIGGNLIFDGNLIVGNTAESGSGGGLRMSNINGTDVVNNPNSAAHWWQVTVTNNIIANNVAGWDGGGVSIQDALRADFINNTVVSNDTTASAGVLFNTLGAAHANNPPPGCTPNPDPNAPQNANCFYQLAPTTPQPAGLSVQAHSSNLAQALAPLSVNCPADYSPSGAGAAIACKQASAPRIRNDLFWDNRAFHIGNPTPGTGLLGQQNVVTLLPTLNQTATGQCVSGASYWDIGYRGDTSPTNHSGTGFTLAPANSILTSNAGYPGNLQSSANPGLISVYCNGARVPPENGGMGYNVPPGMADATLPNPVFSLTASATVDEGNNWVNMSYGPLSLANPTGTTTLGNYSINGGPAVNAGAAPGAPTHDFFGNSRPQGGGFDIGAVEMAGGGGGGGPSATLTPTTHDFGSVARGTTTAGPVQVFVLTNTGTAPLTGVTQAVLGGPNAADYFIARLLSTCGPAGGGQLLGQTTLAVAPALGSACVITVQFRPLAGDTAGTATSATLTVTDAAGTQVSTLSGVAQ